MTAPRVLCLGEVLYDRIADQVGVPLNAVQSWTDYPGGAPANVACALVKLGTSAGFMGCVGQDAAGQSLTQLLQQTGVDTTGIQRHPTAPTRTVLVLRSETGERTFAAFGGGYSSSDFADTKLQASQLPADGFLGAEFLVLGTLEMAYPDSRHATLQALQLAQQADLKIVLDVNWRPVFWADPQQAPAQIVPLIDQVNFLKLSDDEAIWLLDTDDPAAIAQRFPHLEGVLVTAGAQGCRYWLAGQVGMVPAFAVEVVDTTGAGDSFLAGLVHQLCQRGTGAISDAESAAAIVRYAAAVGALTTSQPGAIAAQPIAAEVETFLQSVVST